MASATGSSQPIALELLPVATCPLLLAAASSPSAGSVHSRCPSRPKPFFAKVLHLLAALGEPSQQPRPPSRCPGNELLTGVPVWASAQSNQRWLDTSTSWQDAKERQSICDWASAALQLWHGNPIKNTLQSRQCSATVPRLGLSDSWPRRVLQPVRPPFRGRYLLLLE